VTPILAFDAGLGILVFLAVVAMIAVPYFVLYRVFRTDRRDPD
jgi:hypothetical protein